MRYRLIDRVLEVDAEVGRLRALKHVTLGEEYLADHFPTFPVLPGVLMVEALVQAGRALASAMGHRGRLVLGEAKAVKFGSFVAPGECLEVEISLVKRDDDAWSFKAEGMVGKDSGALRAVSGRLVLRAPRTG